MYLISGAIITFINNLKASDRKLPYYILIITFFFLACAIPFWAEGFKHSDYLVIGDATKFVWSIMVLLGVTKIFIPESTFDHGNSYSVWLFGALFWTHTAHLSYFYFLAISQICWIYSDRKFDMDKYKGSQRLLLLTLLFLAFVIEQGLLSKYNLSLKIIYIICNVSLMYLYVWEVKGGFIKASTMLKPIIPTVLLFEALKVYELNSIAGYIALISIVISLVFDQTNKLRTMLLLILYLMVFGLADPSSVVLAYVGLILITSINKSINKGFYLVDVYTALRRMSILIGPLILCYQFSTISYKHEQAWVAFTILLVFIYRFFLEQTYYIFGKKEIGIDKYYGSFLIAISLAFSRFVS